MTNLPNLQIIPHPSKLFFKERGIPIAAVARHLDLSFGYVSNLLSGVHRMTPRVDAMLNELVDELRNTPMS